MANDTLKKHLARKLVGVGQERIAVRTQGCWNCIHANHEGAAKLWWEKARGDTLARGVRIATSSKLGEKDPRVVNLRRMVPATDEAIERKQLITCKVGRKPDGTPVADFVFVNYLCDRWCGATGASVAREGQKADKLPEELFERFNDDGKTE